MPSVTDGQLGLYEGDRLLAREVEKLSPPFLDKPLKAIRVEGPDYPNWVMKQHTGEVLVKLTINPQGLVTDVTPRAADKPELVRLVTEALAKWRFEPPTRAGQPTSVRMALPFRFVVR